MLGPQHPQQRNAIVRALRALVDALLEPGRTFGVREAMLRAAALPALVSRWTDERADIAVRVGAADAISVLLIVRQTCPLALRYLGGAGVARPSPIPSLCTHFTRAGIEWLR